MLIAAPAHAQTAERPGINCAVRYEDCDREIAILEGAIRAHPHLAAVRRAIDDRLAEIAGTMTTAAALALDQDETRYRRSLRRDLFATADHTVLDEAALIDLHKRLERRLAWLGRITTGRAFEGRWVNASGDIIITRTARAHLAISANLAEIDFLKWTCELEGEGRVREHILRAELGDGEQLELRLGDGILQSTHVVRNFSKNCGANGHANGVWFRIAPEGAD
ncbi:MAG: hypothetical protein EON93_08005 [Burkholderiales bacterium]|nr:MAG: hypothetical protein EON93_08005 [Burkholderiales bacterium]